MQSRKLAVGLAILATLTVVDSALAYYNPSTGRFLNRDPIGEPGAVLVRQVAPQTAFIPRDTIGERSLTFLQQNPVVTTGMDSRDLVPGDPSAGRMEGMRLARAAIREPNPYAYVLNSPANAIDPIGLKCDPPNGCSYSPDYPLGFKFKPCCDDHDRCYCTCGKTQPECDDAFERCLLQVCDRYLDIAEQTGQLGTPWGEWLVNLNFQTCRGLAHTYAGAVRSYGGGAFEAAQRAEGCCP